MDEIIDKYGKNKLYGFHPDDDEGGLVSIERGRLGKIARSMRLSLGGASVGKKASFVTFSDINNQAIELSSFIGKTVVLYVWSSECEPCKKSLPYYKYLAEENKHNDFYTIGLNTDKNRENFDEFIKDQNLPFVNIWIGQNNKFLHDWNIGDFPTTIIVDKYGYIKYRGSINKEFLEFIVNKII